MISNSSDYNTPDSRRTEDHFPEEPIPTSDSYDLHWKKSKRFARDAQRNFHFNEAVTRVENGRAILKRKKNTTYDSI